MRRLSMGDSKAWAQLIDHWSPRLYNYVLYNVTTEVDAQALLQTIFADIVKAIVGSLRSVNLTILLFAIAHRQVLRYRQQHLSAPATRHPYLRSDAAGPQQMTSFWQSFQNFTPELQQILLLHYLCGLGLPEISQIVEKREEELLRVLHRAKHVLWQT